MRIPNFFRNHPEQQLQDILMAHAEALLADGVDRDTLLDQIDDVVRGQAESLLTLAENVQRAMAGVVPSDQFVKQLKLQLTAGGAQDALTWWHRLRQLPPRTQIAAGIGGATITAGLVLLASRSMPDALEFWRNRRTATV